MARLVSLTKFMNRSYSLGVSQWKWVLRKDPCCYCGGKSTTKEHVIPLSQGGYHPSSGWTCVGACRECNRERADEPFLIHFLRDGDERHLIRTQGHD